MDITLTDEVYEKLIRFYKQESKLQSQIDDFTGNKLFSFLSKTIETIDSNKSFLLWHYIKGMDPILKDKPADPILIQQFEQAMKLLQAEVFVSKRLVKYQNFYFNQDVLKFIARNPQCAKDILALPENWEAVISDYKIQNFVIQNLEKILAIAPEKRSKYAEIFLKINNSPSQEIQRLKDTLLEQILETDNPEAVWQTIQSIFEKNNLPTLGKVFKVFQTLHPQTVLEPKFRASGRSPILTRFIRHKKFDAVFNSIIYPDLLKCHILSANRSLRECLEVLEQGEKIVQEAEKDLEQLDKKQKNSYSIFLLGYKPSLLIQLLASILAVRLNPREL